MIYKTLQRIWHYFKCVVILRKEIGVKKKSEFCDFGKNSTITKPFLQLSGCSNIKIGDNTTILSNVTDGNNSLIDEATEQLKILTIFFTVPYAGIIAYGKDFLKLWLRATEYTESQYTEIYVLMILVLLDIIISTYMYSIHSVFIAIDRVKVYSVILFMASLISMSVTLILLKFTELGVYAIAGTSTIVLGFTHGVIVPGCAAKLLKKPIWLFWKSELKSWISLAVTSTLFGAIKFFLVLNNWKHFFISIMIVAALGYFTLFFITFDKNEKREFVKIIKDKLSNE